MTGVFWSGLSSCKNVEVEVTGKTLHVTTYKTGPPAQITNDAFPRRPLTRRAQLVNESRFSPAFKVEIERSWTCRSPEERCKVSNKITHADEGSDDYASVGYSKSKLNRRCGFSVYLSGQKVLIPPVPCQASFVIKTQLQTPHLVTGTPPLTKVFINATYADEVPEQQDAEKLRGIVNCVVSDVRETADKGEPVICRRRD